MGVVSLVDGGWGNVVLVGSRQNPKGAVLILPEEGGKQTSTMPLREGLTLLHTSSVIDILCMQERTFGTSNLPPPAEPAENS